MSRVYNFSPGPCTLPLPALEKAQAEFIDYHNTGMSIIESSHRGAEFKDVHVETKALLRQVLGIPEDYHILFLGGGASLQFTMIPQNFIPAGGSADYINTGTWSKKAIKEANIVAKANVVASSEADNFSWIPSQEEMQFDKNAAYLHFTSNNTIFGTEFHQFPETDKPLVCDMSSDIMSRPIDVSKFAMIYAGAQKNLGPAGVTVVIIRDDFAKTANKGLPTMLAYDTHIDKDSMFNTPPAFGIYMIKLVLEWLLDQGGLETIEAINRQKAELFYGAVDASEGYYRGTARPDSRSRMNATMRLESEELEKKFIAEAAAIGLMGLKGHRSVGGIRVSMYNAMPLAGIEKLVAFMARFKEDN
ncbi:MAG: 3-phosphoserine/phosphohydroxythreonine transaminase [Candidatus Delongbacteria bacterium]|nr:3-phosphoserine/phosphohydroxythreonine transaminase [Candidatus Delongbacteria bacterium]